MLPRPTKSLPEVETAECRPGEDVDMQSEVYTLLDTSFRLHLTIG